MRSATMVHGSGRTRHLCGFGAGAESSRSPAAAYVGGRMSAEDIEEFVAFVKDERLALFPWLNLEGEVPFGGYVFAPVFVDGKLHTSLESDGDQLRRILSLFCDEKGRPITSGTFALASTGEWALPGPKHEEVKRLQGCCCCLTMVKTDTTRSIART